MSNGKISFNKMHFKAENIEKDCEELLACLDDDIRITIHEAPIRERKTFKLDRSGPGNPSGPEAKLERRIWRQWGPQRQTTEKFIPGVCEFVQSYWVPLYNAKNDGWAEIDMLGVAPDLSPVVIELKTGKSTESLLRLIIEPVAYWIALRKNWYAPTSRLRSEWGEFVGNGPEKLEKLTLICAAQKKYWDKASGVKGVANRKEMLSLVCMQTLLNTFKNNGFNIIFASIDDHDIFSIIPTG